MSVEALGSVAEMSSLTCVYFAMLAAGVLYSLVILVAGGHDFDFSGDVDVDLGGGLDMGPDALHGSVDVVSISPVTIAGFVTAFGAFGIISQGVLEATAVASLVWASIGGVLVGLVSHLAFIYFFIKPQGSSEVTQSDIVGATGDVTTPIPSDSVGEIAIVAKGARFTMTARSASEQAIARGKLVKVVDVVGSIALVDPVSSDRSSSESTATEPDA